MRKKVLGKVMQACEVQRERLRNLGVSFVVHDLSIYCQNGEIEILIDVCTSNPIAKLDGMQIIYLYKSIDGSDSFEVSEYQVNNQPDVMYVYGFHKTLKAATTSLLKGNHRHFKRKPVQVWK